jgi:hypothetical protein
VPGTDKRVSVAGFDIDGATSFLSLRRSSSRTSAGSHPSPIPGVPKL